MASAKAVRGTAADGHQFLPWDGPNWNRRQMFVMPPVGRSERAVPAYSAHEEVKINSGNVAPWRGQRQAGCRKGLTGGGAFST